MILYLVRHGDALSESEDPRRGLSKMGRSEVQRIAALLQRLEVRVDRIECSKKQRAQETAKILADAIDASDRVFTRDGMCPDDSPEPIIEDLGSVEGNLLLVGHLPFMEKMASLLMTGSPDRLNLHFSTAAVACLYGKPGRDWELQWMARPEMV